MPTSAASATTISKWRRTSIVGFPQSKSYGAASGQLRPHAGPSLERLWLRAAVPSDRNAVDQHVPHPGRLLRGQALGSRREVAHALDAAGAHGLRIEHTNVGPVAFAEVAAAHEAEEIGRLAGHLAYCLLERHERPLPHPGGQQVRVQRRVA